MMLQGLRFNVVFQSKIGRGKGLGTKDGNKFECTIVKTTNVVGVVKVLFFLVILVVDICKMIGVKSIFGTILGKILDDLGIVPVYTQIGISEFSGVFLLFEAAVLFIPFVLSLIEVLTGARALRLYNEDGVNRHLNGNLWLKILSNGFLALMIFVFELSDWALAFECLCVMVSFFGLS